MFKHFKNFLGLQNHAFYFPLLFINNKGYFYKQPKCLHLALSSSSILTTCIIVVNYKLNNPFFSLKDSIIVTVNFFSFALK